MTDTLERDINKMLNDEYKHEQSLEACDICEDKGSHYCMDCGKEITFMDCKENNGYCDKCTTLRCLVRQ